MSREEIDKILSSNLDDFDQCITKRIQAIDHITNQNQQSSNFLAQFQQMLMLELQRNEKIQNKESSPQQIKEQNCSQQAVIQQFQPQDQVLTVRQTNKSQIVEKVKEANKSVLNLKQEHQQLGSYIKKTIDQQLFSFMTFVNQSVEKVFQQKNQEIDKLKQQNTQFKQQISLLKQQITKNDQRQPLKQLNCIQQSNQTKNIISQKVPFQPEHLSLVQHQPLMTGDSSFQFFRNQTEHNSSKVVQQPIKQIKIPTIKPLCIGVPPVKNGFGILKSGSSIIYKGMWHNGKFQGKGHLNFANYVYQGDFKAGTFHGYGKLQVDKIAYMGKFELNMAQGEGSYNNENQHLHGFWHKNSLLQKY